MAEIVASLLGPAIELGKCAAVPIKRNFRYLCCFDSNIKSLGDEAKKLDLAKDGLQMEVVEAQNNGKTILPQVANWLTRSNEIQLSVRGMEIEISNVQKGCLAIKSRFSLSRRADETTEAIKQLIDEHSKFGRLYVSPPPTSMESSVPLIGQNLEFDSRKQIEEDIMTSLRDDSINLIGLCGLGGVGKTTMAKRVMNRAREEHLFDEVVMVVVSQQKDLSRIQLECAESLGLKLEQQTLSARAHTLRLRLTGKKRILMVLDDIWSRINLEDVGIPCESGCTVLLTSRNRDVLSAMDVQKVCAVQVLSEREAWLLFKEKAGTCVDDLNLIVKDVVNECKGLPVALVTVAKALKDKRSESIWKDALRQLRTSNPTGLFYFLEEVYNPLKLSYDFLDNPHAKSTFLLCSMFPEDTNISLEKLTLYGWGLRMFEGVGNLEEARNNVYALTDMLKTRSLLLDGDFSSFVRMHDVIRDTAIFIASKEGRFNLSSSSVFDWWREHPHTDCTWISLYPEERVDFLSGLIFQNLRLLLINNSRETRYQICDQFFVEETNGLNVLSISFSSIPQTIQSLKHLRTLYICACTFGNISVVGELSSLEILYCLSCDLEELPTEIGKLNRLRLLQVVCCRHLKRIAPGALSPLVQLEELKIVDSFDKWDIASLSELESLSNLTCLEIEIQNSALMDEELCLSQKIEHYMIRIGEGDSQWLGFKRPRRRFEKKIYLDLQRRFTPRNWIHPFLKNGKKLYLQGYDSSNNWDLSQSQNIKWLELRDCPTVKTLVSTASASIDSRIDVFPFLKTLYLFQLSNLEEICDGPIPQGSNSFKNLKELLVEDSPALKHLWKSPIHNVSLCNLSFVKVFFCDSMHSLFSLAIAKDCLPQLGQLYIGSCKMMGQVLCNEENGTDEYSRHITFAGLKCIHLQDLETLTTFCKGIENIEFPLLTAIRIYGCPNLKSIVCWSGNDPISQDGHHNDDSFHLFCNQRVAFGNLKSVVMSGYKDVTNIWCCLIPNSFFSGLKSLKIDKFNKISSLFSSSIAQSLVNLKYLYTSDCQEMIQVIADNDVKECDDQSPILFSNLEELYLENLPKLESFCEWRSLAIQLPSLTQVRIDNCFRMERWSMGSLTTPNLQRIEIDGDEIAMMDDLNDILQKKYQMKKNEEERDNEKDEIHEEENLEIN